MSVPVAMAVGASHTGKPCRILPAQCAAFLGCHATLPSIWTDKNSPFQVLVSVELALWSILHDMAAIGCPLPLDSKWVWGGDRRQEQKPGPQVNWHSLGKDEG